MTATEIAASAARPEPAGPGLDVAVLIDARPIGRIQAAIKVLIGAVVVMDWCEVSINQYDVSCHARKLYTLVRSPFLRCSTKAFARVRADWSSSNGVRRAYAIVRQAPRSRRLYAAKVRFLAWRQLPISTLRRQPEGPLFWHQIATESLCRVRKVSDPTRSSFGNHPGTQSSTDRFRVAAQQLSCGPEPISSPAGGIRLAWRRSADASIR